MEELMGGHAGSDARGATRASRMQGQHSTATPLRPARLAAPAWTKNTVSDSFARPHSVCSGSLASHWV